ncbi:ubiquitin carboxyl-terminal hydrolase [Skeletonema marinoi]|uniref:Ubiquitin carboxyl-terminal hydrolase n=1 Tax=Skeletonema marinoi TaxID=267567 RepID=A0AAD8YMP0_9STRA|nr:ubiquitin carboxyl-terminal hydrolase [Skeletonema marinoi]
MGYDQHDSQELCAYLLDILHEDTNRVRKKPYVEKPEQEENESDEVAADKHGICICNGRIREYWRISWVKLLNATRSKKEERNEFYAKIVKFIQGCKKCSDSDDSDKVPEDVPMEGTDQAKQNDSKPKRDSTEDESLTLEEYSEMSKQFKTIRTPRELQNNKSVLESTTIGSVTESNTASVNGCAVLAKPSDEEEQELAVDKIDLAKMYALFVHLPSKVQDDINLDAIFIKEEYLTEQQQKEKCNQMMQMFDFPLNDLDLRELVTHWDEGKEPIYDLYAVSNHFGGVGGGHYTAYAKGDDGTWCNFDDSRVTSGIDESEVVSPAAYCLYYKRKDVTFNCDKAIVEDMARGMALASEKDSSTSDRNDDMEIDNQSDSFLFCDDSAAPSGLSMSDDEPPPLTSDSSDHDLPNSYDGLPRQ